MDMQDLSIAAMGRALRAGTVSAEQLARDALARVAARDPALQAFVLVTGIARVGGCAAGRSGIACRPRPRADAWHSLRAEGHLRHRGHPHDLSLQTARGQRSGRRTVWRQQSWPRPAACFWASWRHMNSPSAAQVSICRFRRRATRGTPRMSRAVRRRVRQRRSPRAWCGWPWGPIRAARSGGRRHGAGWLGSSRPMAACRGAAYSRCPGRWTIAAR